MSASSGSAARHAARDGTIPPAAAWLGGLGLLPFVFLATNAWVPLGVPPVESVKLIIVYGAVILSFLGGIQWGLAIAAARLPTWSRLMGSVAPALVGWFALTLAPVAASVIMAVALFAVLAVDQAADRRSEVPTWYLRLRWPLTIAATISLLLTALAAAWTASS